MAEATTTPTTTIDPAIAETILKNQENLTKILGMIAVSMETVINMIKEEKASRDESNKLREQYENDRIKREIENDKHEMHDFRVGKQKWTFTRFVVDEQIKPGDTAKFLGWDLRSKEMLFEIARPEADGTEKVIIPKFALRRELMLSAMRVGIVK